MAAYVSPWISMTKVPKDIKSYLWDPWIWITRDTGYLCMCMDDIHESPWKHEALENPERTHNPTIP